MMCRHLLKTPLMMGLVIAGWPAFGQAYSTDIQGAVIPALPPPGTNPLAIELANDPVALKVLYFFGKFPSRLHAIR